MQRKVRLNSNIVRYSTHQSCLRFSYIDKPLENTPAIYQTLSTPHKDEVHVEILRTRQVGVRG